MMPEILFRFKKPRRYQDRLLQDVYHALRERRIALIDAPTGIGKTDGVLSPAITLALDEGLKILFLTPKISQHEIAIRVAEGISKKYGMSLNVVEVVGKRHACLHPIASKLSSEDFYEFCKLLKEQEKCPFYVNALENPPSCEGILSFQRAMELGREKVVCPYELLLLSARDAIMLVGDYYHVFSPKISQIFLYRSGTFLEETIIIVDEAHNLPERIRKIMSSTVSLTTLEKAKKEAEPADEELSAWISDLREWIAEKAKVLSPGEERLVEKEFEPKEEIIETAREIGLSLIAEGKKSSHLLKLARFLERWIEEGEDIIRVVRRWKDGVNVSLSVRGLDPSRLSAPVFESVHSGALMSGTLRPQEMYADLLGIGERAVFLQYPSPFPPENRLVLIYPKGTTRFSKRSPPNYRMIARELERIIEAIPGNVAVFFPSYEVLEAVHPLINLERPIFVQRRGMSPGALSRLLAEFKAQEKGVLLAVAGGSLSEGVDYPGKELIGAIIVGIPLPEVNLEIKALIRYYQRKFGKGITYALLYPGITKAVQAAGRCIRSEEDVGVIIFMDERYAWKNYRKLLPKEASVVSDPVFYIKEFFKTRGLQVPSRQEQG